MNIIAVDDKLSPDQCQKHGNPYISNQRSADFCVLSQVPFFLKRPPRYRNCLNASCDEIHQHVKVIFLEKSESIDMGGSVIRRPLFKMAAEGYVFGLRACTMAKVAVTGTAMVLTGTVRVPLVSCTTSLQMAMYSPSLLA